MVQLAKQHLYKETGKTKLPKQELEEVIVDTEKNTNNRRLLYIDNGI